MRDISFRSGSSSFNSTTLGKEAQNRFASTTANSSPPVTTTSITQASGGLQRPVAMPSMQAKLLRQLEVSPSHQSRQEGVRHSATTSSPTLSISELNTMLAKAFDAQRLDINTQAGPSNSRHLNALNKLQQRRFKPAAGGLEIPFTPNSLLGGGGKRVYHLGSLSRDVRVNPRGVAAELRQQIDDKKCLIDDLTQELQDAHDEGNPTEIENVTQRLRQAELEHRELAGRLVALGNENSRINR